MAKKRININNVQKGTLLKVKEILPTILLEDLNKYPMSLEKIERFKSGDLYNMGLIKGAVIKVDRCIVTAYGRVCIFLNYYNRECITQWKLFKSCVEFLKKEEALG